MGTLLRTNERERSRNNSPMRSITFERLHEAKRRQSNTTTKDRPLVHPSFSSLPYSILGRLLCCAVSNKLWVALATSTRLCPYCSRLRIDSPLVDFVLVSYRSARIFCLERLAGRHNAWSSGVDHNLWSFSNCSFE